MTGTKIMSFDPINEPTMTDEQIKAANLAHALFLKARLHDKQAVNNYVNFINNPKGKK